MLHSLWPALQDLDKRRVKLPTVSSASVADGYTYKKPPRKITFPIRPQDVSVGLFAAAILQNISDMDRTGHICQRCDIDRMSMGPALRADPSVSLELLALRHDVINDSSFRLDIIPGNNAIISKYHLPCLQHINCNIHD